MIRAKSSIGFHLPRSFEVELKTRFLLFLGFFTGLRLSFGIAIEEIADGIIGFEIDGMIGCTGRISGTSCCGII